MDLLEAAAFAPPLILLQTVAEEVRHRSLPLHNRLRALAGADDRRVWSFYNEFRACISFPPLRVRARG
jgi:exosome complex exonuclease DIS3/RRP44